MAPDSPYSLFRQFFILCAGEWRFVWVPAIPAAAILSTKQCHGTNSGRRTRALHSAGSGPDPRGWRPHPNRRVVNVRILVTGGAGFIGSHLCERLLKDKHEVICLDNFFSGKRANIAHLRGNENFELIRHDVVEPILLEVDRIFHLACPASPVHYQYNPVKTTKTNVMGTINMLGLAKRVRARILLSSTSEVYGDPEEHPQRETYWGHVNPIGV